MIRRIELVLDLTNNESNTLEYKEKINDGFFKSLSAFANTEGGTIFLGISDKKEVKGIDLSNGNQEKVINQVIDLLGIQPKVEEINY